MRGGEIYRLLLPFPPFLSLPQGASELGQGPGDSTRVSCSGTSCPLGSDKPRRSEPGARGQPEAQRRKAGPSSPEPFSYDCLPSSQLGIGGPINLMISPLRPQEAPPPATVTLFSNFSLNLSVCCFACA